MRRLAGIYGAGCEDHESLVNHHVICSKDGAVVKASPLTRESTMGGRRDSPAACSSLSGDSALRILLRTTLYWSCGVDDSLPAADPTTSSLDAHTTRATRSTGVVALISGRHTNE